MYGFGDVKEIKSTRVDNDSILKKITDSILLAQEDIQNDKELKKTRKKEVIIIYFSFIYYLF